jgi:hypothetical protein
LIAVRSVVASSAAGLHLFPCYRFYSCISCCCCYGVSAASAFVVASFAATAMALPLHLFFVVASFAAFVSCIGFVVASFAALLLHWLPPHLLLLHRLLLLLLHLIQLICFCTARVCCICLAAFIASCISCCFAIAFVWLHRFVVASAAAAAIAFDSAESAFVIASFAAFVSAHRFCCCIRCCRCRYCV